jgi:UDP-N-acetylmuramyl pentapeptide phosphotransferase/UDP-N-acetylglucosamine-1-phosphate transferase
MIGGVIILVGVTLAFLVSSFVDTSYGYQAVQQAEATAVAGAEDALLQLDRNINLSNTSGYAVAVGLNSATVTITQNSPVAGKVTILSIATVSGRKRKVNVVLSTNITTGQATVVSWQDIP